MLLMLILSYERKAGPMKEISNLGLLVLCGNRIAQGDAFQRSFTYIFTVAETKSFSMSASSTIMPCVVKEMRMFENSETFALC